jgi:pyruvate ferredoxin oxidoreductase gamma subunit
MYRIRFHGRGGQGMKTASRILGTALFLAGYEVQDAPRYGAERRGAPIFAYVRAARHLIYERGVIRRPDLVVVADDSLIAVSASEILQGVDRHSVLLVVGNEAADAWKARLNIPGAVLALPFEMEETSELHFLGAACAGAAACLVGVLCMDLLQQAIREELVPLGEAVVARSQALARAAWQQMETHAGCVTEGPEVPATDYAPPAWIDLEAEDADISAAAIHAGLTSVEVRTGLWRTLRPVIDYDRCNRCWWVCSEFCPDSAITVGADGTPHIDYDHCKGCMVCVAQCPPHAIRAIPEHGADKP